MLCPEVWNFEPPPSSSRYRLVRNEKEIQDVVGSQYFNHFVSITIPDSLEIPSSLHNALLENSEFYHVKSLYAFELVEFEFIQLFIRKGSLTLLSVETKLDEDDCIAITPTKKLIFSLCRKSFQELGIEGKPSTFSTKTADKYVVVIDLAEECFRPGKKNYERVFDRLQFRKDLCFNVILAWESHEKEICPSSVAAYMYHRGYKVTMCPIKWNLRQKYNVRVPDFNDESDGEAMTEWLGAFGLQCDIPEKPNGFVTTFQIPENNIKFGQVVYLEAFGLFTNLRIKNLVREIINYSSEIVPQSWIGLQVNGFEDSVVNRGNQEHFFYSFGDYHFTVFFSQNKSSLLCVHTSSTRRPKFTSKKKRK